MTNNENSWAMKNNHKNNTNSWYTMIGNDTIEHTWHIAIHSLNNPRIDQSLCDLLIFWPSMIGIITLSGTALLISCRFTNPTICKVGVSTTTLGRIMFGLPDLPVSTTVEFSIGKWTPLIDNLPGNRCFIFGSVHFKFPYNHLMLGGSIWSGDGMNSQNPTTINNIPTTYTIHYHTIPLGGPL